MRDRLKEIYAGSSKALMLSYPYEGINHWEQEFALCLYEAKRFVDAAKDMYDLYKRIIADDSVEFKGPLRVRFILSGLSNGLFNYLPA